LQTIDRQPYLALDGATVHYGCHRPAQTTLYRRGQGRERLRGFADGRFLHWAILAFNERLSNSSASFFMAKMSAQIASSEPIRRDA